jgi:hypothetical protein
MRNIIWKRPDGGISVTHIIDEKTDPTEHAEALRNQALEDWQRALKTDPQAPKPAIIDWSVVAVDVQLPESREWRDAWAHCPVNGCRIDMDKARDIQRARLRTLRAAELAELDIQYQRADEKGDKAAKAAIALRKQQLRDVTDSPEIAEAKTLDSLSEAGMSVIAGAP